MDYRVWTRDLETRLSSGNCEVQVRALSEARQIIETLSKAAVQAFEHTDNPFIFADVLRTLGPSIVPYLESLYRSYGEGESRTILAISLLSFGSKIGVADVLRSLQVDDSNQFLAASKLAGAGVMESAEPISQLLREYALNRPLDVTTGPQIGTLIDALLRLGVEIPADVRARLTGPAVSKLISAYVPSKEG